MIATGSLKREQQISQLGAKSQSSSSLSTMSDMKPPEQPWKLHVLVVKAEGLPLLSPLTSISGKASKYVDCIYSSVSVENMLHYQHVLPQAVGISSVYECTTEQSPQFYQSPAALNQTNTTSTGKQSLLFPHSKNTGIIEYTNSCLLQSIFTFPFSPEAEPFVEIRLNHRIQKKKKASFSITLSEIDKKQDIDQAATVWQDEDVCVGTLRVNCVDLFIKTMHSLDAWFKIQLRGSSEENRDQRAEENIEGSMSDPSQSMLGFRLEGEQSSIRKSSESMIKQQEQSDSSTNINTNVDINTKKNKDQSVASLHVRLALSGPNEYRTPDTGLLIIPRLCSVKRFEIREDVPQIFGGDQLEIVGLIQKRRGIGKEKSEDLVLIDSGSRQVLQILREGKDIGQWVHKGREVLDRNERVWGHCEYLNQSFFSNAQSPFDPREQSGSNDIESSNKKKKILVGLFAGVGKELVLGMEGSVAGEFALVDCVGRRIGSIGVGFGPEITHSGNLSSKGNKERERIISLVISQPSIDASILVIFAQYLLLEQ
ncbi:MAG: hypothetical protein EZS28_019188 [Streblomastix strix]|uniref:C2 domain-containing protein n=1 Tax=Streblomastix strix TaxID=222440 RepID=A0A5J4VSV4_9EUKA|nr:MAG: hypothetical protein EZS28_019188 [Streblomastix strix]